jgi:hypothetical protein
MRNRLGSMGAKTTLLLVLPLALLVGGGCSRSGRQVPAAGSAREALESALSAWQSGQPVGKIETASPPVHAVDSGWRKGQKLASYEILEEVTREDGRRCFKVRLNLQQPAVSQEVQYLVVGTSPMWIYREDDYKNFQNWEGYK